jgi:hypothetical protein
MKLLLNGVLMIFLWLRGFRLISRGWGLVISPDSLVHEGFHVVMRDGHALHENLSIVRNRTDVNNDPDDAVSVKAAALPVSSRDGTHQKGDRR